MVTIQQLRAVPNAGLRQFTEAWLQWRGEALLPRRSQVELTSIKALLPMVAMLEVNGADDVRYRVVGTRITEQLGFDPTGRNYAEFTPPGQWPVRSYRLRHMASWPCGGALHYEEDTDLQRVAVAHLTLPLLPDAPGGSPLLLSCIEPLEPLPHPEDDRLQRLMGLPQRFAFVDIGKGVPETIDPLPLN
jgi:hypothetical protein